jgi:putative DNA methylase
VPVEEGRRSPEEEADFFKALCRWGGPPSAIEQARKQVLAANGAKAPAVLDMFAGGGAIPLEAARLGCLATALELNPVAHLVEKVMLEFPQAYPGVGDDVRKWGARWVESAWEELADVYPPVSPAEIQGSLAGVGRSARTADGRRPIAYLWTRTVRCPNPALAEHRLHLVRQTWLARKTGRSIALRPVVDRKALSISYEVVQASTPAGLGFDPAAGCRRGEATCAICGLLLTPHM